MKFLRLKELSNTKKRDILNLWNYEYHQKLKYHTLEDFESYLEDFTGLSHILLIYEYQKIKAWYVDFSRENKKRFAIILVANLHGQGIGT